VIDAEQETQEEQPEAVDTVIIDPPPRSQAAPKTFEQEYDEKEQPFGDMRMWP
jgi:hypothetical protein